MTEGVVVTGMGIVSCIGFNVDETLHSLMIGKTGIGKISILDSIHRDEFVLGEIKLTQKELMEKLGVDLNLPWTRTALLGVWAARQAYQSAGLSTNSGKRIGLVSASTVGGMDRSELYYKDFLTDAIRKNHIDTHHAGNSTEMIADDLNIHDYLTTISTACSSSLNSIMFGARLLRHNLLDAVIVGGTDALSRFTLNGFNTLMILDHEHCRPFDATRRGLNLGEGAGYLVLERTSDALAGKKQVIAQVAGYANANDAFHQTASSDNGEGPFLAMQRAVAKAGITAQDIDYINVHGTGTDNNDLTEGVAMKRLFGDQVPPFSSTKAFTGHTLGATGVIESIISILSMNNDKVFPNINFKEVIEEINLVPVSQLTDLHINHVLTNSFGFGGNDSSVVFSKVPSNISGL
ncbi:MAG: beta-ketoacyl-[acyl-carrier-protein] synthase family protein [Bacteroidetes bacterium HGW-Bacteroidetes-16]|jgi:3-oxoacyl-[acyl-carrier-protein] synthase-1|nr:MAG: beta-ketoacyl-[acyl-carrier-protein] synthase family protein [Bacteroidetes bacterium HGW-Bacteroidetes-16]